MNSRSLTEILLGAALVLTWTPAGEAQDGQILEEAISANELLMMCQKLGGEDPDERWASAQEIIGLGRENAHVIQQRLQSQYDARPENMRLVLTTLRKKLKDAKIADLEARGKKVRIKDIEKDPPPQFVETLVRRRNPNYPEGWRDAVEVMVLLLTLTQMGSTDTIGFVLDYSPSYEAAFRKEIYQMVMYAGPRAVPALVRRQNVKDEDINIVVSTALSEMKMERPGQQVQVKDHRILMKVLQAFGDHKNIDALDTVAAFMNSDKDQVRETARTAMRQYGKLGLWTLKKEYKEYVGEMPDPDWDASRIADELFARQDEDRMAPLNEKMNEGLEHAEKGEFLEMEKVFREILARQPFFGRRQEMVPGYMSYGQQLLDDHHLERAMLMYKVAQRVDAQGAFTDPIKARLLLIEGLMAIDEGAPDTHPLEEAIRLDPDLKLAKETLAEVKRLDHRRKISRYRILGALGIGSAALIILSLLIVRRLGQTEKGGEES